jgi:hypothetical protein
MSHGLRTTFVGVMAIRSNRRPLSDAIMPYKIGRMNAQSPTVRAERETRQASGSGGASDPSPIKSAIVVKFTA